MKMRLLFIVFSIRVPYREFYKVSARIIQVGTIRAVLELIIRGHK